MGRRSARSYEELLSRAKYKPRRRKFDNTAQKKLQLGSDSMDVVAAHENWEYSHNWDKEEIDVVGYCGYK